MEPIHSLLKRQLKRYLGNWNSQPKDCQDFIAAVNNAYRQFDADRAMLERSLDLSSQELLQANSEMRAVYERLINSSVDGIIAFDRECRYTVWNPGMENITGISMAEVLGKCAFDLFPFLKETGEDRFYLEALAGKTNAAKERPHVVPNRGRRGFFESYYSPLLNEASEIIGGLAIIRDVSERKGWEERLQYAANYDALTGLPNRTLFADRLGQALVRAPRHKRLAGVLFLNLNRFKIINDTLGHGIGDQLLKAVAKRLSIHVRDSDTVARYGDDEFVIVLEDVAAMQDVPKVIQKILDSFSKPFIVEGHELFITPSIGISLHPNDGEDVDTLVKNADTAMARAKDQGKSYQFYSPDMNVRTTQRLVLESSLRHALERNELLLHYQPMVDITTGQITGKEALVRWHHPDLGLISPAEFIPLAEETGIIIPIGEWVLHNACMQNRILQASGFPPTHVSVNLSARQFQQQNLVETVDRVLKETGLDPNFLDLELTESILMKNVEAAIGTLGELKAMGIKISIDDFGTGYSSLNYLKRFPIHRLKIDQSFVRDITTDPDVAAINAAIITLAHSLKLKVTAEGVETKEQLEFLRSLKCDEMQGYLFSRPVPAEAFIKLLQEKRCLPNKR